MRAEGWLRSARAGGPPDSADLGTLLRWVHTERGLTQQGLAELLHTSQSRLSKIEHGVQQVRDVEELRFIAARLGFAPQRLGVLPDRSTESIPDPEGVATGPGEAWESQRSWLAARRALGSDRAQLAEIAAQLYPGVSRVAGTAVLSRPDWLAEQPVPLSDVELEWVPDAPPARLTGSSTSTRRVRPLHASGERYARYAKAVSDLARPRLLDNRACYRLVDTDWTRQRTTLACAYTSYFDVLDICEAVAHELAAAWLARGREGLSPASLPLRSHLQGCLFDLRERPVFPSINTLTVRREIGGLDRFYLHHRDPASVASAGGVYHVMPAGAFQPSSLMPAHQANDFSLWRTIQREYSEEFLGHPEHDGQRVDPIDYGVEEPLASLDRARAAGDLWVHALGVVLEPLTLWAEVLTVAVIDAEAFDRLFAGMVVSNDEGDTVGTDPRRPTMGVPFTSEALDRLATEPLSPITRALLALAWQHRRLLLAG